MSSTKKKLPSFIHLSAMGMKGKRGMVEYLKPGEGILIGYGYNYNVFPNFRDVNPEEDMEWIEVPFAEITRMYKEELDDRHAIVEFDADYEPEEGDDTVKDGKILIVLHYFTIIEAI